MKLNRQQLAEFLGVSLPGLDGRIRAGMPFDQRGSRGKEWIFDSKEVVEWEKDRAVRNAVGDTAQAEESELKRRKLAAETTIAEIDAAKARGLVAELATIERAWSTTFAEFRQRILQVPARSAPHLIGMNDARAIKALLIDELTEALRTLGESDAESQDRDVA